MRHGAARPSGGGSSGGGTTGVRQLWEIQRKRGPKPDRIISLENYKSDNEIQKTVEAPPLAPELSLRKKEWC